MTLTKLRPRLITALTTIALLGFGQAIGAADGPPSVPVEASALRTGTVSQDVTAIGTLLANESVTIRPEIIGKIAGIHFEEGQRVAKDAELVTLDAAEYRAQVAESTALVQITQISFDRSQQLLKQKLTSRQQYDEDAAKLAEARARQALDRERLNKTTLRAPFAGVLGLRQVSPGDVVQPGQDIVNLEDIDSLKLDFRVPERYLSQLKPGLAVTVSTDAFTGEVFAGQLYVIAPRLDEASRSLLLRARVANPEGKLRPGMFVRVTMRLSERQNAILVPEEALWPIGQKQFVYTVVEGKAKLVPVKTGQRLKGEVEVTEGLSGDEIVITAGQLKIRDGAGVMVINQPQADQPAS